MKKILILLISSLFLLACSSKKEVTKEQPLLNAEDVFEQADKKAKDGYYEEAVSLLEGVKTQDVSGKYAPLAQIRIGDIYFNERLYEEAVVEYEHFLNIHSYHKYASYAQYKLAMSYFKRIGTVDVSYSLAQKAMDEFKKLLEVYPRNPYVSIVENRIKMCKSVLAEYEFYVGQFYFKKGSYTAAVRRFNTLLRNYPHSKKEAEALYYLGLSYKNAGETDKSLQAFTTLVEKYPTIELSREAREIISSLNEQ